MKQCFFTFPTGWVDLHDADEVAAKLRGYRPGSVERAAEFSIMTLTRERDLLLETIFKLLDMTGDAEDVGTDDG
jgi:hypothetical protein